MLVTNKLIIIETRLTSVNQDRKYIPLLNIDLLRIRCEGR